MLQPNELRAARALLGVKQGELAKAAGVSLATLNNFERGIGDPRASTVESIENALSRGGITFSGDQELDAISYRKVFRPNAFDGFNASRQVLEFLDEHSLLKISSIVFFQNTEEVTGGEFHAQNAAIMLVGRTRMVLFDQAKFSVTSSRGLAEIAGIMLAAYSRHEEQIFHIPEFVSDTSRISPARAIEMLGEYNLASLKDPMDFFELFRLDKEKFATMAVREEHPLGGLLTRTNSRLLD